VRGEEWISSTPKHVLLYSWLGWEMPQFAHMPLLRNSDKSKISKRKNPAARLLWFREQGFLPEALVNFLGLVGYSDPDGREVFSFEEMSASFDWARVNTVGPVFDIDKLTWLNGHYIRSLAVDDLARRIATVLVEAGVLPAAPTADQLATLEAAVPLVQERMNLLTEAVGMVGFLYADGDFAVDPEAAVKHLGAAATPVIDASLTALAGVDWSHEAIEAALRGALIDGLGLKPKNAFGAVRVAVTGRTVSPPLFESLELLGRDRALARLRAARSLVG
jgi:glutamyl-tRNA synthetase